MTSFTLAVVQEQETIAAIVRRCKQELLENMARVFEPRVAPCERGSGPRD